ncbi:MULTISPECIES: hypothetical protein [Pseudoxanthomonas]|jgi:hypothetical protein|uniref:Uncharacterized protein n=1 Tax=Pseudoxanthomonas taiwanensis J19 TaxID=935569 RepID=A0A562E2J9_9GAMM|nr:MULTISPECIES: hypothetical protein [Pseudoxanthomonas]TWH16169.1 hypothetical protein L613_001300000010 [Pseudoxanthomonas taiwanensis J19]
MTDAAGGLRALLAAPEAEPHHPGRDCGRARLEGEPVEPEALPAG